MDEVKVEVKVETCPACSVKIEGNAKVIFSAGPPGTKERLWARVCQFTQKPGCLLEGEELKPITAYDRYD